MITLTRDDDDFAVQLGLVLGSLHRRHDDDCEDLFGGSFSRLEDTSLTWQTSRLDARRWSSETGVQVDWACSRSCNCLWKRRGEGGR